VENPDKILVTNNLFFYSNKKFSEEIFEVLLATKYFKIERIISQGQYTPDGVWLEQDMHEWVILVKGAAKLSFKDSSEVIEMNPGDYILIPANTKHRVEWTDPNMTSYWLAIHYNQELKD